MNLEYRDELAERYSIAYSAMKKVPSFAYSDCRKMAQAVYELLTKADVERINCRRLKRTTDKFVKLMQDAEKALDNFEAHIVFAQLMKKDIR